MVSRKKVVLITGAGSGIGRATALLFSEEVESKVIVIDYNQDLGKETVDIIIKKGGDASFFKVDISNTEEVREMTNKVIKNYNRIDVLANVAGAELVGSVIDTSEEDWDRVMAVNQKGIFLMSKYILPEMIKQKQGAIINISSISGLIGWPGYAAYCTSKGGVIMLTKQMAVDYAKYNIRVNCICPGTTLTPMVERLFDAESNPEEAKKIIAEMHPLGRFAKPVEIANVILFLALDESSFITGAILPVDGGYTAK